MIPEATATTLVTGAAKSAIGHLVRPLVTGALSGIRTVSVPILDLFIDRFSEYIHREMLHHSYLSTIVFGNQKLLEDLYIPLTVVASMDGREGKASEIVLSRFRAEFLPKIKRALITDTAGMGKSTLLKFLFLQCVKSNYGVPIFVELRHLSQTQSIVDLVMRQLNPGVQKDAESYFSRQRVDRIFKKGGLVFFLDGYDEIPFKDRERVTRDVKGL
jgi:hypothetical protein